jgi:trehalose-6-phosphatase
MTWINPAQSRAVLFDFHGTVVESIRFTLAER